MEVLPELSAAPRTNRYEIQSLLGRGASGIVYRAFDLQQHMIVALKSLRFLEPEEIFYLKNEFRSLSSLSHPGLVRLYELDVSEEHCFFTMELIEGRDFLAAVRQPRVDAGRRYVVDYNKLRHCLGQFSAALEFLHDAGKLHRDIKPSNVIVTPDGRTVLVDFGLSQDVSTGTSMDSFTRALAGTPAYMAPERLAGVSALPASDWFGLGVMLYEALAGRLPFVGDTPVALYESQKMPPAEPRELVPDTPADLNDLAMAFMDPDPSERPGPSEVYAVSGVDADRRSGARSGGGPAKVSFIGRDAEKACLRRAFDDVAAKKPRAVFVDGVSGVGKTSLVTEFLNEIQARHDALVLRSRCHYQETIRYKAVDGIVDNLTRHLMLEDPGSLASITPKHTSSLVKAFPVLERVPFEVETGYDDLAADPQVILRQAITAFRDLVRRIAETRNLVLWIDDVQWSDMASVRLIDELMRQPDAPPVLLLLTYRAEDRDASDVLEALTQRSFADIDTEAISLEPLPADEMTSLVRELAGGRLAQDTDLEELVTGTAGLPFFALELVRQYLDSRDGRRTGPLASVSELLSGRVLALNDPLRDTLELVAVSGQPLREDLLMRLAGEEAARNAAVYVLCRENLLRKTYIDGQSCVESYHDQIRMATLGLLEPDMRSERHLQIAEGLRTLPDADPVALAEHYVGAGRTDAASAYALDAARHASEQLAFDRAAELMELALNLRDKGSEDWELMSERATMLANAGRARESGLVFNAVTEALESLDTEPLNVAQYRVRAAEQHLYAGALTRGLDLLRIVFHELGLPAPDSIPQALRISLLNRLLSMVNLRAFRGRPPSRVDASVLLRLDTIWVASKGTVMLDIGIGDAMTSWYMREASASGDRSRIARALCLEASICANIGGRLMWRRALSLNRRAEELMRHSDDPYDQAWLQLMYVAFRWMEGDWEACVRQTDKTVSMFRRNCLGVSFDVASALAFGLSALAFQGRLRELSERTAELLEDAERRGDTYFKRVFESSHLVVLSLAADEPEEAMRRAATTLEDVPTDRFTSMHYHYFVATIQALLYDDRPWEAWELVERHWPQIKRTGFLRLTNFSVLLRDIRARVALRAACEAASQPPGLARWDRRRLMRVASGDARTIRRRDVPHAVAHALAIDAGIAAVRGQKTRSTELLARAAKRFEASGMRLHSESANLLLSTSLQPAGSGDEGDRAREWMVGEGVKDPLKMARVLIASGTPGSS